MGFNDVLESFPLFPHALFETRTGTIAAIIGTILVTVPLVLYLTLWVYPQYTSTYANLPGPPPDHWFWGNMRAIMKGGPLEPQDAWSATYGPTLRYSIFFNRPRLYTIDPHAMAHILQKSDTYTKSERVRRNMADLLGNGVLVAEGADHRNQRKILNPSFSAGAVREMMPIFYDKAYELKDKMLGMIEDTSIAASSVPAVEVDVVKGGRKIDVMRYLGQTTLDVIGIAGFNYDFKSLSQPKNELAEAYRDMFQAGQSFNFTAVLQAFVPGFKYLPTERTRTIKNSTAVTRRIGKRLVEEKKRAIEQDSAGGREKGSHTGKDLLSILIKANMAADIKPEQRMSDDDVLAQITTFMLAGNETSSTGLTWILYMLSLHPEAQDKLREELAAVTEDRPTMEALSALPYLDAVVRETLRLLPPASSTIRTAMQDDVVPLGTPITGRDGKTIDSVHVTKGSTFIIPIMSINKLTSIWGDDAHEFKPERHLPPPDAAHAVPGIWGNLLTFLGGQRNCIGYRFALAEMKSILFVLIRNLRFEELPSKPEIEKKSSIVMRPKVKQEAEAGLQMPLMVKPVSA